MRPLYAEFFREAAEVLDDEAFVPLAEMYAELGRQWSNLANAASARRRGAPYGEAKELLARREELFLSEAPNATEEIEGIWTQLTALEKAMSADFPLTDAESSRPQSGVERAHPRNLRKRARRPRGAGCSLVS